MSPGMNFLSCVFFFLCRPPPPPYSLGSAQTLISSNSTSNVTGVIYPGASNKVEV